MMTKREEFRSQLLAATLTAEEVRGLPTEDIAAFIAAARRLQLAAGSAWDGEQNEYAFKIAGENGSLTVAESDASPSASKSPLDLCTEFDAVDHAELDRRLTVGEALDTACEEALGKRLELALQFEAVLGPVHDEFYERYEALVLANPCQSPAQLIWKQMVRENAFAVVGLCAPWRQLVPHAMMEVRASYERLGVLLGKRDER